MTIATTYTLSWKTATENFGLICSLTVLALFLSYSMLNVCDSLSTDGCFTTGSSSGALMAVQRTSFLSILQLWLQVYSGFVTAILQLKLGDSLLAGIIVITALYSVNIAVMGVASLINIDRQIDIFHDERTLEKVHR